MRVLRSLPGLEPSPDLAARAPIVIEQADAAARFRGDRGSRDSAGTSAYNGNIEGRAHSVATTIPRVQFIKQVRWCGTPLTIARHSMQIPIPQRGPRGSPRAEVRQGSPAATMAAATVVPGCTVRGFPFSVISNWSAISIFRPPEAAGSWGSQRQLLRFYRLGRKF
jgi:hypothetical protein